MDEQWGMTGGWGTGGTHGGLHVELLDFQVQCLYELLQAVSFFSSPQGGALSMLCTHDPHSGITAAA
jgi:hypothetical protein